MEAKSVGSGCDGAAAAEVGINEQTVLSIIIYNILIYLYLFHGHEEPGRVPKESEERRRSRLHSSGNLFSQTTCGALIAYYCFEMELF